MSMKSALKELFLPVTITVGLAIGVGLGLSLTHVEPRLTNLQISLLMFPGDLMIQLMKVLLLPMTTSSIIVAMARMDIATTSKIGVRALVYYITTMLVACCTGLAIAYSIKPGRLDNQNAADRGNATDEAAVGIAFLDFIRNLFPENLIEACFRSRATFLVRTRASPGVGIDESSANSTSLATAKVNLSLEGDDWRLEVRPQSNMNLLGLLAFSMAFGSVLSTLGETGRPLYQVIDVIYQACIKLILIIVWYVPVGIIFLTAGNLVALDDPYVVLTGFSLFFGVMCLGVVIHGFIFLPLLYFVFTRKNPFVFTYHMFPAMLTAFATESSAATIPVTTMCLEDNNHIDARVVRLMVPVGATINMDGSALYLCLLGVFVANLHEIDLNIGQIFTIVLVSLTIAIGSAGVPGGGAGTTEMLVLTSAGLPVTEIYMILALYWLGARLRTVVNVMGDAYGSGIVGELSAHNLGTDHAKYEITSSEMDCMV